MCTVSFVPTAKGIYLTSNRDEHYSRNAPLVPVITDHGNKKVAYPKDATAGGTWFAMNSQGVAAVLLNGAFARHQRTPPYRKSRGLIVLELIGKENPREFLLQIDLMGIEPFTLVVLDVEELWEFRWDGERKHPKQLDSAQAHIWSSWTLYNKAAQEKRNAYFAEFMGKSEEINGNTVINFHKDNHGDLENGFVIDRANGLRTLSVTQVHRFSGRLHMRHEDLALEKVESCTLEVAGKNTVLF